ncbi:hypothetical protein JKP88DRAFT_256234, partial [Tribonema minus]
MTIADSVFNSNSASGDGGCVYAAGAGKLSLLRTIFFSCDAPSGMGGAVYARQSLLNCTDSSITGSTALQGAVVVTTSLSTDNSPSSLSDGSYSDTSTIHIGKTATARIHVHNSRFVSNSAMRLATRACNVHFKFNSNSLRIPIVVVQ